MLFEPFSFVLLKVFLSQNSFSDSSDLKNVVIGSLAPLKNLKMNIDFDNFLAHDFYDFSQKEVWKVYFSFQLPKLCYSEYFKLFLLECLWTFKKTLSKVLKILFKLEQLLWKNLKTSLTFQANVFVILISKALLTSIREFWSRYLQKVTIKHI